MSMFNDISCDRKGNKEECLANAGVVKVLAKKFGIGQWSFIGPGSETKCYSGEENSRQGACDHITDEMLLELAESGHPIFRAATPLSRRTLRSEGHGKTVSSDQEMDDVTFGKLLAEVHRDCADYRRPEGVCVSPSSMSVMVDRTGKPVEWSDSDHFGFSVRNMYSAQNQFPVITQAERMVDRTGKPVEEMIEIAEERESSSALIRTFVE